MQQALPSAIHFHPRLPVADDARHKQRERMIRDAKRVRQLIDQEPSLGPRLERLTAFARQVRVSEYHVTNACNIRCKGWLSGFLHGEQGALSLSISLCEALECPKAVEYAANQAREEARHVTAFTRYIESRWGGPLPVNPVFGQLLESIVSAKSVHRKMVGMQLLVEGLAMGFMAALHTKSNDPILRRLAQLVMTDEAFHHKAGKLWAELDMPQLDREMLEDAEDWALACFKALMFNVFNPTQKAHLYAKYGLSVEEVRAALKDTYQRRAELSEATSVFRILTKTLIRSGLVSRRTRENYAQWIDLNELEAHDADDVEDLITAEGLALLEGVNRKRRDMASAPSASNP